MRKLLLAAAAATMLGGLGLAAPASAAVVGSTSGLAAPTPVEQVRMTWRERRMMRHHRMMRHRGMRARMRSDMNSKNPSRPGYMQNKGQTSGGPRY